MSILSSISLPPLTVDDLDDIMTSQVVPQGATVGGLTNTIYGINGGTSFGNTITVTGGAGNYGGVSLGGGSSGMWNGTSASTITSIQIPFTGKTSRGEEVLSIPPNEAVLDIKGKVRIDGEYLDDRLKRIETILQIPTRDVTMEAKYPKLRKLYEEYLRELEKLKTWDRLQDPKNDKST